LMRVFIDVSSKIITLIKQENQKILWRKIIHVIMRKISNYNLKNNIVKLVLWKTIRKHHRLNIKLMIWMKIIIIRKIIQNLVWGNNIHIRMKIIWKIAIKVYKIYINNLKIYKKSKRIIVINVRINIKVI
jgi:hypothetical protein